MKNKTIKIASTLALIIISMFFTVGLPTNVLTGEWELHSIYEMQKGGAKTFIAVFLLAVFALIVAQWYNEKNKGGKNVN